LAKRIELKTAGIAPPHTAAPSRWADVYQTVLHRTINHVRLHGPSLRPSTAVEVMRSDVPVVYWKANMYAFMAKFCGP
jgi:hypothetical protein